MNPQRPRGIQTKSNAIISSEKINFLIKKRHIFFIKRIYCYSIEANFLDIPDYWVIDGTRNENI